MASNEQNDSSTQPVLDNNDTSVLITDSIENEPWGKDVRSRYYTLPLCRFTVIVKLILFIDLLSSLTFWLTGGHTQYLIENIFKFHMKLSVFDLAVMSTLRTILLFIFYDLLESVTLRQCRESDPGKYFCSKLTYHLLVIFTPLLCFGYSCVKGSLILICLLDNSNCSKMHVMYYALVISSVAFCFIELCLGLGSYKAMQYVKKQMILHRFNNRGQEIDEEGKPIKKKVDLIRLMGLAKPEACWLVTGTLCLLVSSAADTAAPFFFGLVVNAALQPGMGALNRTIVILLLVYLVGAIASMCRSWLFTLAGQRLVARLRKILFNSIIKQDIAFFDVTRTGELTNRLSSDTQVLQNAVTVNISMLSRYLLQIIGSLSLMFYLNPALTGVLLAVVPVVSLSAVQYGQFVKKMRQDFQDRLADASTTAEETISSLRTVRSFCGEHKSSNSYGRDIDKSYGVGKKLAAATGIFNGLIGILMYGAITLVLWYGGKLVNDGVLNAGTLTSFLLYTLQVAMAFAFLSSLFGDFMQALGASLRIFELLDRQPEVPNEGGAQLEAIHGGIEFENVTFTYPSRPETKVLKGVSFVVKPGQVVALVGPSGGGKSTMVNLIERFYDPEGGTIYLGGRSLPDLDPQWYRKKVAMVSQEPVLFACSIKDNITYGKEASMEQIEDAAKQANAHDFIMSFEDGYNTLVGERGIRLSGGQKQRVAIARALIMDPTILLLDEATSALDAESEHLVQEAIDRAMENRTVLVIAHRLSTVRNANVVVVIDKGEVAELGSHEDLIERDGVYKKLVLRQLLAGKASSSDSENNEDLPVPKLS